VEITEPNFVYILAENEPSYHKAGDGVAEENNTSGEPLDSRKGDTAVVLYGKRYSCPAPEPGGTPILLTDWYLGSRIRYTRMLNGQWCPGDCPLNEWRIDERYYKDNMFHEFTTVDAVIGLPQSDRADWYIGTEQGWNNEPSPTFWLREDVRQRVAAILAALPLRYEVQLKVTDGEGRGFSDSAHYSMVVHAPLENYKPIRTQVVYLPKEVNGVRRPSPTHFIPEEAWGAIPIAVFDNPTDKTKTVTARVQRSDSYRVPTVLIVEERSASNQRPIRINQNLSDLIFSIKFGEPEVSIATTTFSYPIGKTVTARVPPYSRVILYAQRLAHVEEGQWDVYGWDGYLGTIITKRLFQYVRYEWVFYEEKNKFRSWDERGLDSRK
jgi:hypothetical protein